MEHSVIVHTQHDREGFAGVESEGTLRTRDSAVMSVGRKAETSRCSRKRLKRTHFWLPAPEKDKVPPSCPAGVTRDRRDDETAPPEAVRSILTRPREGTMEILTYPTRFRFLGNAFL